MAKPSREYDISFGHHSNIPPCCIKFYLDDWPKYNEAQRKLHFVMQREAHYVQCPNCHGTKPSKLHYCSEHCLEYLTKELGMSLIHAFNVVASNLVAGHIPFWGDRIVEVKFESELNGQLSA